MRRARRFGLIAPVLAVLVAVLAAAQFATSPHHYTATEQLRVAVLARPGATAQESATLADGVAAAFSSPVTLATPQLAAAILAHISSDEQASQHLSAAAIEGALAASHSGSSISLSATWTSPQGAQDVLVGAVGALQADPALAPSATPAEVTVRLQTDGPPPAAARTPGEESTAISLLLGRIALGLIAAALLPFTLALILPAQARTPSPSSAA